MFGCPPAAFISDATAVHLRQSLVEARQADASDVAERTFHFMSVGVVDV